MADPGGTKRKRSQSAKVAANMVSSESIPTINRRAGVWTEEEDRLLQTWQQRIGNKWSEVARYIPGKTGQQCAQRWRHKVNPDIKRSKWEPDEDALLLRLVQQYGTSWASIAKNIPGRTDQQCMGRWKRHLDPNINRDDWTHEEDIQLCALFLRYETQWSSIARALDGRTAQQCRTRWVKLNQNQYMTMYRADIESIDIIELERAQELVNKQRESVTGLPTASTRMRVPGQRKDGKKSVAKAETIRNLGALGARADKQYVKDYLEKQYDAPTIQHSAPQERPQAIHKALQAINNAQIHRPAASMPTALAQHNLGTGTLQYLPGLLPPAGWGGAQLNFGMAGMAGGYQFPHGYAGYSQQGYFQNQSSGISLDDERQANEFIARNQAAAEAAATAAEEHKDSSLLLEAVAGFGGTSLAFNHGHTPSFSHGFIPGNNFVLPLKGAKAVKRRGRPRKNPPGNIKWETMPLDPESAGASQWSSGRLLGLARSSRCGVQRSAGRKPRASFDEDQADLKLIDAVWRHGGIYGELAASLPVPIRAHGVVEDGTMLSINCVNQHLTPLKPKELETSNSADKSSSFNPEDNQDNKNKDNIGFFSLEYLADEKVPGSKTPLSALKRVPRTAASPMLADLLRSPQINPQGLLASPAIVSKRSVWNPMATPEGNRLVRCLDMSDVATASICGTAATATAATATTGMTPGSPIHAPLVLDSASRVNLGSVMMKNLCDTFGLNNSHFVQMPISNAVEGVVPVGQACEVGLASHAALGTGPEGVLAASGDKAVNKRRLSSDSVRMSLFALLDKA